MKDYKRRFAIYSAWDYTREVEDLNKLSAQGWQLIKGGLFSSLFKKNKDIRYCYQLDFNTKIEDMGRYIEIFHEQGWEYVNSTWNGWHFFRKIYDPALDGEEFEIYNDTESLKEMQAKWQTLAKILLGVLFAMIILEVIMLCRYYTLPGAIITLSLFIEMLVIARGIFVMKNPQRADGHKRKWNGMPAFIWTLFIGVALSITLVCLRNSYTINNSADSRSSWESAFNESTKYGEIKINYPDFYLFEVEGKAASTVTVSLLADEGEIKEQIILDPAKASGKKGFYEKKYVFLKPGKYQLYFTDFAGGAINFTASIN